MNKIKIAIVGMGNCASSLIQGIHYYDGKNPDDAIGLMHWDIGGYSPSDIDVVAAFPIKTLSDMEKFTVAGVEFQFIEIPNEHTPGGGQLADLTHKVIYSGDSLGAQIQYGGTNFYMSNAQNW